LLLQAAKMIREDFLHQNAFDDRDTYTSMEKQFKMLDLILTYFNEARPALEAGALLNSLLSLKVLEDIARAKLIEENALHQFDAIKDKLTREIAALPR
jgi:V/A-type H+-transporting ATPase subunit A